MVQFSYTGYYAIVLSTNHKTVNTKTDPWWHVNYNIRHQYLQYQHPPHHCSLDRYQSRDCWSAALCSVGLVGPLSLQNYTWKKKTIVCYSNDWLFTLSISVYWPHLFKSLFAFDSVEGERNLWSPVKNRIIISFTLYIYINIYPKILKWPSERSYLQSWLASWRVIWSGWWGRAVCWCQSWWRRWHLLPQPCPSEMLCSRSAASSSPLCCWWPAHQQTSADNCS